MTENLCLPLEFRCYLSRFQRLHTLQFLYWWRYWRFRIVSSMLSTLCSVFEFRILQGYFNFRFCRWSSCPLMSRLFADRLFRLAAEKFAFDFKITKILILRRHSTGGCKLSPVLEEIGCCIWPLTTRLTKFDALVEILCLFHVRKKIQGSVQVWTEIMYRSLQCSSWDFYHKCK